MADKQQYGDLDRRLLRDATIAALGRALDPNLPMENAAIETLADKIAASEQAIEDHMAERLKYMESLK